MKYYLFLDDERFPNKVYWVELPLVEWVIVRSYDEFIKTIEKCGLPEFISWDHDLQYHHYEIGALSNFKEFDYSKTEKTGYHAAKWLIDYCIDKDLNIPKYTVHSMNPCGKKNIESLLESFIRHKKCNN